RARARQLVGSGEPRRAGADDHYIPMELRQGAKSINARDSGTEPDLQRCAAYGDRAPSPNSAFVTDEAPRLGVEVRLAAGITPGDLQRRRVDLRRFAQE